MDWRTMTREQIAANPMAYWRLKFLERRRAYPDTYTLALSEYGFMRLNRARRVLDHLAQRELDIAWVQATRQLRVAA